MPSVQFAKGELAGAMRPAWSLDQTSPTSSCGPCHHRSSRSLLQTNINKLMIVLSMHLLACQMFWSHSTIAFRPRDRRLWRAKQVASCVLCETEVCLLSSMHLSRRGRYCPWAKALPHWRLSGRRRRKRSPHRHTPAFSMAKRASMILESAPPQCCCII